MNGERPLNGQPRDDRQWHLGKEVPLALLVGLLIQTSSLVWWLANLSSTVTNTVTEMNKINIELIAVKAQVTTFTGAIVVPAAVLAERVTVLERSERETRLRVDSIREEQMRRVQQIEQLRAAQRGGGSENSLRGR